MPSPQCLAGCVSDAHGPLAWLVNLLLLVGAATAGDALGRSDNRWRAQLFDDALAEIAENLVEVALAYDEDERAFRRFPNLCLANVGNLVRHEFTSGGYNAPLLRLIEREVARDAESLLGIHRRVAGSEELEDAQGALQDFVETSLRLVLVVGQRYAAVESAAALAWPGLEDLRRCAEHGARVAFYSSEAQQQSDLGSQRPPVVCWVDDCAPDGAMVLPQFEKFRRLVV